MKIHQKVVIFTVLASFASQLAAQQSKNDDESKPYEFGFTIDGEQHRHEKKDDKGIIQGEFGFITADGIYHVTVYATDENGNFKILSMKNVRISAPLDGSPGPGPAADAKAIQGQSKSEPLPLQLPEPQQPPVQSPSTQPPITSAPVNKPYEFTTQPTIKPACAGCGYVTTQKAIPGQPFPFQTPAFKNNGGQNPQNTLTQQNNGNQIPPQEISQGISQGVQEGISQGISQGVQQSVSQGISQGVQQGLSQGVQQGVSQGISQGVLQGVSQGVSDVSQGNLEGGISSGLGQDPQPNPLAISDAPNLSQRLGQDVNNQQNDNYNQQVNQYTDVNQQQNTLTQNQGQVSTLPPISVSNNAIQVGGKNPQTIPIKDKFPGMEDGLPDGISENDITDLLYKFHYTVGFHGHWEKGLKNGAKVGGYFVNGRDGVSRVVTYIADENGYRPKFKFVRLGLDSDETPKEGTEKTFGLKSFEFVWYPVE